MSKRNLPAVCPSCEAPLKVQKLQCGACATTIEGAFALPVFSYLTTEEQRFLLQFIKKSGSLKDMASEMSLSYPSVRNLLDDLIQKIQAAEKDVQS